MAGLRRHQQRSAIARVKHEMVHDVAKKMRPVRSPALAPRIAVV
jgi:hypothetical protein